MSDLEVPLLSPKPLALFEPQEFHDYVRGLYEEPVRAKPPAEFSVSLNAKGNPVIRVRREPKWLLNTEVEALAEAIGWTSQRMWLAVRAREIEIRIPDYRMRRKK